MKVFKSIIKNILGDANMQSIRDYLKSAENDAVISKRKSFYSHFAGEGDLCFDVGANMGNRIEVLLSLGCRVVAVEPQPECCKYLKRKFGDRIQLVQKGLGPKEEIRSLHISDAHTVSSFSDDWIESVQKSKRFGPVRWGRSTPVEMTTLDQLIHKFGVPKFIKIDVEGFELEVLKGLSVLVRYISFEYTVPEQTNKAVACLQHLQQIAPGDKMTCNFSVGESMEWGSGQWLTLKETIEFIQQQEFTDTNFGDIYIRLA